RVSLGGGRPAPPQEAGERPLERGEGAVVVDLAGVPAALRMTPREAHLRPLPGALGPGTIDLLGRLRDLGEDDHPLRLHLREAAHHGQALLLATAAVRDRAVAERGEESGVARQAAEVP